jgi:hypothetical protein
VFGLAVDRVGTGSIAVRPAMRRASVVVPAALAATCFLAAAVIAVSGGFDMNLGWLHVSAHTATNPLRLGWISALLAGIAAVRPRITFAWRREHMAGVVRSLALTSAVVLTGALPLLWHALHLLASADYTAPTYAWRSGPQGVDLLTVVLGHPYHVFWGEPVQLAYSLFDLDPIEQVGWMGIGPLMLGAYAVRHPRVASGRWTVLAVVALIWALGPFLRVAGADTGLPLPQVVQQFIPILSNARVPGRAMALVALGLAMLTALGTAHLRERLRARSATLAGFVICVAILLELWPAAHPTFDLRVAGIYSRLSGLAPGAVLEVPLGIRDGFGELGRLDHEALFHQTVHERPIFGGFVGRLSPRLRSFHSSEPILSSLLTLSSGQTVSAADIERDKAVARSRLDEWRVIAIVVRKRDASPELIRYARAVLGGRLIAQDAERELYVVPGRLRHPERESN